MSKQVILAIGANLDSPIVQVKKAFNAISELSDVTLIASSSLYSSTPRGPQDQDNYVNAAALIETSRSPIDLLQRTQSIEQAFGRVKTRHWGERIIDIDIAFYGDETVAYAKPDLHIPHREALLRDFVLVPALEIAPSWKLPDGSLLSSHLSACITHSLFKIDEDLACPSSNI